MTELSRESRDLLLRLARAAIRSAVLRDDSFGRVLDATQVTPEIEQPGGAFVSLKMKKGAPGGPGTLRGCIGCVVSARPLYRNVIELAPKAALRDPRFSPLTAEELPDLRLEISALGPLRDIGGPDEVKIGRDGVQMNSGTASAVFLPQVAVEQDWTVDKLLRQLSLKAGLPADGWKGATLRTFEAEVFAEPVENDG